MLGDCYYAAGEYILDVAQEGAILIHGRPTLQCEPFITFGHAWVEWDEKIVNGTIRFAYDVARDIKMPISLYYALGKINPEDNFEYTREEARRMILEYGHWGPWEGPEQCSPII
jgi:hypothetical protein